MRNGKLVLQNDFLSIPVAKYRRRKGLYGFDNFLKVILNLFQQNIWPIFSCLTFIEFRVDHIFPEISVFLPFIKENAQDC